MKKTIFMSYCRLDEQIANDIDIYFKNYNNIEIKRDIRDIEQWQSIKEFMKSIKYCDYCILIISDNYLKSINCMFEVLEAMKNDDCEEKILTLICDNANIYDQSKQIDYILYWQNEYIKLDNKINLINSKTGTDKYVKKLNQIENIKLNLGEFFDIITNKKNPSSIEDFCINLKKKLNLIENTWGEIVTIKSYGVNYIVNVNEIIYCESLNRKVIIYAPDNSFCVSMTLTDIYEKLPNDLFCHCHRSYIVNLKYINSISSDAIFLKDGERLPLSRSCKKIILFKLRDYFSREHKMENNKQIM